MARPMSDFAATTSEAHTTEGASIDHGRGLPGPGRVDQAVELPLRDEDARGRLIALFATGLDLHLEDEAAVVATTGA
jgi:hypothetical protein